eukprot:TRINITY_DN55867_c0_g1_i1.p1 TRINITY_DN55867_c0_g1~~TRINITY_DN55867_c0_g1_i1.p1  ORF type:complete len:150 (+),score=29.48 TRINITY_DN55867_c0_g1_i1:324-773(+)
MNPACNNCRGCSSLNQSFDLSLDPTTYLDTIPVESNSLDTTSQDNTRLVSTSTKATTPTPWKSTSSSETHPPGQPTFSEPFSMPPINVPHSSKLVAIDLEGSREHTKDTLVKRLDDVCPPCVSPITILQELDSKLVGRQLQKLVIIMQK